MGRFNSTSSTSNLGASSERPETSTSMNVFSVVVSRPQNPVVHEREQRHALNDRQGVESLHGVGAGAPRRGVELVARSPFAASRRQRRHRSRMRRHSAIKQSRNSSAALSVGEEHLSVVADSHRATRLESQRNVVVSDQTYKRHRVVAFSNLMTPNSKDAKEPRGKNRGVPVLVALVALIHDADFPSKRISAQALFSLPQ